MSIAIADQALLRTSRNHRIRPHLDIFQRTMVATAQLNQTTFNYPLGELTVDTTSAGWTADTEVGQQISIGTEERLDDVTVGVARKATSSNTLFLDGKSLGDPGRGRDIATPFANNQHVTIWDYYPLWTLLSRIVDGEFFKRFDITYTDEGSNPAPVVNLGAWRWAFLDDNAATAGFSFDASASFAWGSKTKSSFLYTLPAGAVLTGGSTTSEAVDFTLPAGQHMLTYQLTDSGGAVRIARRPVWVWDRAGAFAPESARRSWMITNDQQGLKGRAVTVELTGDKNDPIDESVAFPGAAVIYAEEALYRGQALTSGVGVDTYVGYISAANRTGDSDKVTLTLELKSPFQTLSEIPMVSQAIIEAASPANWTEVTTGLGDPNFVMWYILEHHCPNMLMMHDFNKMPDTTPPQKRRWGLNGSSVSAQLDEVAKIIAGNVGSASDGSIHFLRDGNIENNTFRNATMDEGMDLQAGDIREQIALPFVYHAQVGSLLAYAFVYTGDDPLAIAGLAPGSAQAQAPGQQQAETLITADLDECLRKTGHLWAKVNNPTPEIAFRMDRNLDIFDPARHYNTWWPLDIHNRYDPLLKGYSNRMIVVNVTRSWTRSDGGAWIKDIAATFAPETFGQPGVEVPLERGGAVGVIGPVGGYPDPELYEVIPAAFLIAIG